MERVERMYRGTSCFAAPLPREMPWPPSVVPGSIRPHFSSCHIGRFYRHLDGSTGALTFQVDHRTAPRKLKWVDMLQCNPSVRTLCQQQRSGDCP